VHPTTPCVPPRVPPPIKADVCRIAQGVVASHRHDLRAVVSAVRLLRRARLDCTAHGAGRALVTVCQAGVELMGENPSHGELLVAGLQLLTAAVADCGPTVREAHYSPLCFRVTGIPGPLACYLMLWERSSCGSGRAHQGGNTRTGRCQRSVVDLI
jgi:hypothetical protein